MVMAGPVGDIADLARVGSAVGARANLVERLADAGDDLDILALGAAADDVAFARASALGSIGDDPNDGTERATPATARY